MAVAELLKELDKEEYTGLSAKERVALLNTQKTAYTVCKAIDIVKKMDGMLLQGRTEMARNKGTLDDGFWLRWKTLMNIIETPSNELYFNTKPLLIEDLFLTLSKSGVIDETELIWLLDLGRVVSTVGRAVFHRDVTVEDLDAAEPFRDVIAKVESRTEFVAKEHQRMLDEVQAVRDEIGRRDPHSLKIIGDPKVIPAWEVVPVVNPIVKANNV